MTLQHRDTVTVVKDGEEIRVYNWVNVAQPHVVRGGNPTVETFGADIGAGDSTDTPEYVTKWLADELWHELNIEVEDYGIEAIDVGAHDTV